MAVVLGMSGLYHDAAAALVVDGVVVGALQQERVTRVKHDPSLPLQAAASLLQHAGIDAASVDSVVFYENPFAKVERVLVHGLRTFPGSLRGFGSALAGQLGSKLWVLDALAAGVGVPRDRVTSVDHHQSHAAAAYFTSGWSEAAVLCVDGVGEWATTSIWSGSGQELRCVDSLEFPHSLGLLYAAITAWLGFSVNGGEYKVMGLAAFGTPDVDLRAAITLDADGSFCLDPRLFDHFNNPKLAFGPGLVRLLGPPRARGKRWDLTDPVDRRYADVAASIQAVTEQAMLGLARRARERTGAELLCLAGGVALNAVANRRIAAESGFQQVYVQPAAGDAGGALGAAILGSQRAGDGAVTGFSPFCGLAPDAARTADVARALGLQVTSVTDPAKRIAEALEHDKIVALCTGRCEWGPRALGARSLLAKPVKSEMRDRLNARVKHRESFRPFAPAVLAERFSEYFSGEPCRMTEVMTTVRDVRDPSQLGAVTHVDGTARVQSVEAGPLLPVLQQLELPMVLNTSLNGGGEAICGTGVDALSFFIRHPIHALYVDDLEIQRP